MYLVVVVARHPAIVPVADAVGLLEQDVSLTGVTSTEAVMGQPGKKYVVVDQKCQGLGKGPMTAAKLRAHRDAALEEYRAKVATGGVLPLLYGIIMGEMMEQSRKAMESMTPEQKTELEKMFKDKAE